MASLFSKFTNKIRGAFGKKPQAPKVKTSQERLTEKFSELGLTTGNRGRAYRDLKNPDLSPENQAKWRELSDVHGTGFVYDQQPLFVHSSNVAMLQYFGDSQKLMVEFLNGSSYLYDNVTENEAIQFYAAHSKGGAVWSLLRVRGSRTLHKKPYKKTRAGHHVEKPYSQQTHPKGINRHIVHNEE